MSELNRFVLELERNFKAHYNPNFAYSIEKYLRNQFSSFGLKQDLRRRISNDFQDQIKNLSAKEIQTTILALYQRPEREFHHVAMEITYQNREKLKDQLKELLIYTITHQSWWDTVDYIASYTVGWAYQNGVLIQKDILKWNQADNLWLNRTSLIFQLKYGLNTNFELLSKCILNLNTHPDFFIRKAIGWALRQYSKFEPLEVLDFVGQTPLSNLSQKEALKYITKKSTGIPPHLS